MFLSFIYLEQAIVAGATVVSTIMPCLISSSIWSLVFLRKIVYNGLLRCMTSLCDVVWAIIVFLRYYI